MLFLFVQAGPAIYILFVFLLGRSRLQNILAIAIYIIGSTLGE